MRYQEYAPSEPLKGCIKCYYTASLENGKVLEDFAFATGCMEVMFMLDGSPWLTRKGNRFTKTSSVELWGQIVRPLAFRAAGPGSVFGIRFYPETAALLLQDSINQFNDGVIAWDSVMGMSVAELLEQLQESGSVMQMIQRTETYVMKKLVADPRILSKVDLVRRVLREITKRDYYDNLSNVAARYGISSRYMQDVFLQVTGLSPKKHIQIHRFQNSLMMLGKKGCSLTETAYSCGYFDQSHFIREFKTFTGMTPSGFAQGNSTALLASSGK